MNWRSALVTAAWVAVGTGAGGLAAWQLASADAGTPEHGRALDDVAVRRALAGGAASRAEATTPRSPSPSGPPSTPTPNPPSAPSPSPTPDREAVRFTGGTATVECRPDGRVHLVSWSPDDGYAFDEDVERSPAPVARLEAEPSADDADDLAYDITCTPAGVRAQRMADGDD
ncbi:hypothetical protein [Streptomyces sp. NL15-2K]|uniref:hypothetical protein n=1 Tax=Streptomyces sp. NL15-2K TaxID=376149 RepID=UPI000F568DA6|nr:MULTISPECIES: hypothetical protein [Actinomycetes]WKX15805.1 hypothetical protein Q4V64_53250 [Kutzneria buriramensis]GCB42857.1 hypothetical protein SNL152K_140 [Streptomyces sp. NL15-2K]